MFSSYRKGIVGSQGEDFVEAPPPGVKTLWSRDWTIVGEKKKKSLFEEIFPFIVGVVVVPVVASKVLD